MMSGLKFLPCVALGVMMAPSVAVAQSQQQAAASSVFLATGEFVSALATINGGFFNQNNVFVSSPVNPAPDQLGGGPWVRSTGGSFNTSVQGTISGLGSSPVKTSSNFVGVQAGFDLGRYNIGNGGYSVNFGLMGGQVSVAGSGLGTGGSAYVDIPFVGGYVALAGGNFFADAIIREDFFSASTSPIAIRASSVATTGAASVGYRFDFADFYFVPSAALSVTKLEGGSVSLNSIPALGVPQGAFTLRPIYSELGRLNFTVGRDFGLNGLAVSPFFTASVFHEFAGAARASFIGDNVASAPPLVLQGSVGRIGTYGQFSIGSNFRFTGTGVLMFVRADFRTGDHVDGYGVSGGLRYQF